MDKQLPIKAAEGSRKMLYLIIGAVLLCVGFLIGYSFTTQSSDGPYEQGMVAGWEAARVAIAESEIFPTEYTTMLTGTIIAVSQDSIEVKVPQMAQNPLEALTPTKRTISIGTETEIFLTTSLSEEEFTATEIKYQAEYDAWADSGLETDSPEPPREYKLEKMDSSELISGMTVWVTASENIATIASFEAVKISASKPEAQEDAMPEPEVVEEPEEEAEPIPDSEE